MHIDIDAWMNELLDKLQARFGERLVLLGLQGSRARGEARDDSDIDVVVVVEELGAADLRAYREVLGEMPHDDIACGFISSKPVLAHWPRYDSFNLVMDTKPVFGTFDFMDAAYSAADAAAAAKAGASEIYHATCHGMLFDGDALADIVTGCLKAAFFAMRALAFACTGEYPASRKRMKELASDTELLFLDAYDDPAAFDANDLAEKLMRWSTDVIASA